MFPPLSNKLLNKPFHIVHNIIISEQIRYNIFMANHRIYTLNTESATRVTPAGKHSGMDITIQNLEPDITVFVGGNGVTNTSFGYRLSPGAAISFELPGSDALYVATETNGAQIAVLDIGLEVGN
jgi:hypothetical protein